MVKPNQNHVNQYSPNSSRSSTPEQQQTLFVQDGNAAQNYYYLDHAHHPISIQDKVHHLIRDNNDKTCLLNKIQTEMDKRKLMRQQKESSSENIISSRVKNHHRCQPLSSCLTFRVSSKETILDNLKPKIVENDLPQESQQPSHSKNKLISYDKNCDITSLIEFLDSSSEQLNDVLIYEARKVDDIFNDDSDENDDILEYVTTQQIKRDNGFNVTGEKVYRDEKTGMMRNLHKSSVSVTLYNEEPDYDDDFGKSSVFHPIMTMKEKLMLGMIPTPGWKKRQNLLNAKNNLKKKATNINEKLISVSLPVSMKQRGILEITRIKIVQQNEDIKDKSKSVEYSSPYHNTISSKEHSKSTVQNSLKNILLQTLPNPNFEIKARTGRKEYQLKSSKPKCQTNIPILPKSEKYIDKIEGGHIKISMESGDMPHIPLIITNKDKYPTELDVSDIGSQTERSYMRTSTDDSNSENNTMRLPRRRNRKNTKPFSSARNYGPKPRLHSRVPHTHREYVKHNRNKYYHQTQDPNPSYSAPFEQRDRKPSGDATYRKNDFPQRPQCSTQRSISSESNHTITSTESDTTSERISSVKTRSESFSNKSDDGISMLFKKRRSVSDSSSDNIQRKSCSIRETSSSISTSTTTAESIKQNFQEKWKSNRRFKFTSTSMPSDQDDETEYERIPTTAEGDTNFDNENDNSVRTLLYTFPLDENGSSVEISITLPFHVPADSLPFDSPHCAYSILNTARKLIKKNCPQHESSSSQSEENLNTSSNIMPFRCFVDIQEIFSESEESEKSEKSWSNSASKEGSKDRKNLDLLTNKTSKGFEDSNVVVNLSPKMLDKDIQTSDFGLTESHRMKLNKTTRTIQSSKELVHFLIYIFSCGCLRRSYQIKPTTT